MEEGLRAWYYRSSYARAAFHQEILYVRLWVCVLYSLGYHVNLYGWLGWTDQGLVNIIIIGFYLKVGFQKD